MKHIISLGAGVQSSTMALMAAHGEIGPMPDCAIFADTGAEPQKAGILPEHADIFLRDCRERYGLTISGLMCIPPFEQGMDVDVRQAVAVRVAP